LTQPLFCQSMTVALQVFFWQQVKAEHKTCLVVNNQPNGCLTQMPIHMRQRKQEPDSARKNFYESKSRRFATRQLKQRDSHTNF
jgi:hypothetical protein